MTAGLFLLLCWASAAWSIVPRESVRGALGLTVNALVKVGMSVR